MTQAPLISVVIPTYQRCASVEYALMSLTNQRLPADQFEVIVSIDGSEDGTREMVEQFHAPFRLRALWQPNRGRAAACNAGIRAAQGEFVVLLDDDMEATPALLAGHLQAHQAGSNRAVIGAVPFRNEGISSPVAAYIAGRFHRHLAQLTQRTTLVLRDCYSSNFSARRSALLAIGMFDEQFQVYGNEDLDLALRLREADITLCYSAAAMAFQSYTKDFRGLARDSINKGRTAVTMAIKHPETTNNLKIGTFHQLSVSRRMMIALLLTLGDCYPTLPMALVRAIELIEPFNPRQLHVLYEIVLDYCYWYGVRDATKKAANS